jgi:hypothetical protein
MLVLRQQPAQPDFVWGIERYSFFHGALHITGYAFSHSAAVSGLSVTFLDGRTVPVTQFALASPELPRFYGREAAACRFDDLLQVGAPSEQVLGARLTIALSDGRRETVPLAQSDPTDPSMATMDRFFAMLAERPPGHCLEVGSRARTGMIHKSRLPAGWRYTGFDIMDGPNVDIIGDAHHASRFLPLNSFDAVMSIVVFEHLLMPWKAVIEMNRLLRVGALGLVMAPQTWPLHEEPCDYFRFSKHSWKGLFNRATGFEIVEAVHGASAYVVARNLTGGNNFGDVSTVALMSTVIFRKVSDTSLDWPVEADEIAGDVYPF